MLCMWLVKVGILQLWLDKMYYPLLPLFHKYRNLEKHHPEDFKSFISIEEDEKLAENAIDLVKKSYRNQNLEELAKIDDKIKQETEEREKRLNDIIEQLHSGYINDEHFGGNPEKYTEFLNEYIRWYYEPLVPEYEEAVFSIKHFEEKFAMKMEWEGIQTKKIKGIYLKVPS